MQRLLGVSSLEAQHALWELAASGLAAADGFDQLRSMIDRDRRNAAAVSYRKVRSAAGRWSLLNAESPQPVDSLEKARYEDAAIESAARMLLSRYGVVFRDLLVLESNTPRWGLLLRMLRRLEDRGEVRGGRFVGGFGGEQFALPAVLDSLRAAKNRNEHYTVDLAGADPMNLIGILLPGERTHALPGRSFVYSTEAIEKPNERPNPVPSRQVRRAPQSAIRVPLAPDKPESHQVSLF